MSFEFWVNIVLRLRWKKSFFFRFTVIRTSLDTNFITLKTIMRFSVPSGLTSERSPMASPEGDRLSHFAVPMYITFPLLELLYSVISRVSSAPSGRGPISTLSSCMVLVVMDTASDRIP